MGVGLGDCVDGGGLVGDVQGSASTRSPYVATRSARESVLRGAATLFPRSRRLLHDDPAHRWTVAELAASSGMSRAALARRFTAQVGEPLMTYLASWRIDLAADLFRDTDTTVGSIARKVGYANTFALSVAFKRLRGVTPTEHRATAPTRLR